MSDYLDKIKQIAVQLAAAGKPVDSDDLVFFALGGLGPEYEPLAMALTSRTTLVAIEELHTELLTQEHRLSITSQMPSLGISPPSPSTNIATRSPDMRGQGRGHVTARDVPVVAGAATILVDAPRRPPLPQLLVQPVGLFGPKKIISISVTSFS